ncbi:hypothetical protein P5673_012266 [Acropora cervicornis]|uniref:Uncharacterized protein n=1 Tax=Acropora cervicornis TaxID=6130 RepID=A0AAD9V7E8_ACRCE|nr:hypothetical protein P5673_012266 [Acropora cervicornis]
MVFLEVCEMKVQEGGNYCYNCGARVESFHNERKRSSNDGTIYPMGLINAGTLMVRPSRHDTVGGVPDVLFQIPEESGAFVCSLPFTKHKILEMESKCAY